MTSALIETHGLTKIYRSLHAVENCDLTIQEGEVFGLLGPNGSGKTTLIRMLMGYLRPSAGHATIDGLDCYRDSVEAHKRLTYLPAEVRLFFNMRGRDALRFFAKMHPEGDYERSLVIAERLELDLSRLVAFCSTGMKQKIALVATLAARTKLVILDEPTSALDPTIRREVQSLLKEAKAEGRTVLFSSHVLSETEATCDRVCILRKGRLVHTEAIASIRREHRIRAVLTGPMPSIPSSLAGEIEIHRNGERDVTIQTAGELRPLFGWLATLPIDQVRVEPISLQVVYDRYHGTEEVDAA